LRELNDMLDSVELQGTDQKEPISPDTYREELK
jgi:hypothetical protein